MTKLTSPNGEIEFGPGHPVLLINDQLRIMDQSPAIFEQLRVGNLDGLLELARLGQQVGTDAVDILINHPDLDEVDLLPRIAVRVIEEVGCPVSLDSRSPEALTRALEAIRPYKALINSVTAEQEVLEALLPVAKTYGAAIVGMPIGRHYGLPKTVEGRLCEAQVILQAAEQIGIDRQDVMMDAICLGAAGEPGSFQVTLDTLRAFNQELGVSTILGIGNAGYGLPEPTVVDLTYLAGSIPWGLDAALVNPSTSGLLETVRAMDFLTERDPSARRYIQNYRKRRKQML